MDTMPQPAAPALAASLRHLRRLALGGVLALALLGAAAGLAAPAGAAAGDPSQWGVAGTSSHGTGAGAGKVSMQRKVNEYEGQHRLGGQDPEFPVTPT